MEDNIKFEVRIAYFVFFLLALLIGACEFYELTASGLSTEFFDFVWLVFTMTASFATAVFCIKTVFANTHEGEKYEGLMYLIYVAFMVVSIISGLTAKMRIPKTVMLITGILMLLYGIFYVIIERKLQ